MLHCNTTVRNRLQHYILNYILVSRYHLTACGIPKSFAVKWLLKVEHILFKLNIISQ